MALLPRPEVKAALSYELLGTHPQATAQSTSRGKTIHEIQVFNNKLYTGYGDYGANTGPVHMNPFDLSDDTFDGSQLSMPTEEVNQIREIGGKLYAPAIDPSNGCFICSSGYGVGEPWEFVATIPGVVHVFDMATLNGTDLWAVGSGDTGDGIGSHVWRSTDGGDSWEVVLTEYIDGFESERYYWIAELNGKVYMQNYPYETTMRSFDGTSWSDGPTETFASTDNYKVEVFNDYIVAVNGGLQLFDGETVTTLTHAGGHELFTYYTLDLYVEGEYLYMLSYNYDDNAHQLMRTTDLETWQELGQVPADATAIAADENHLYIGTSDSKLYRSTGTIPDMPTVSIVQPTEDQKLKNNVTLAIDTNSTNVASVKYKRGNKTIATVTNEPYEYSWNTTKVKNKTYELTAILTDEDGNVVTSEPVSVEVANTKTATSNEEDEAEASTETTTTVSTNDESNEENTKPNIVEKIEQDELVEETTEPITTPEQPTSKKPVSIGKVALFGTAGIALLLGLMKGLGLLFRP